MKNKNIHAVVGASDPEMVTIISTLNSAGIPTHQALCGGKPVHPGNAYQTDAIDPPLPDDCVVWRIECDGPAFAGREVVVIDHHRPNDPGYGMPPSEFWAASSIGQVVKHLEALGVSVLPEHAILCAAADHCLAAAYRGECPGVDPDALMKWRAESRAHFQKRSVEEVVADVEAARLKLRVASTEMFIAANGRPVFGATPEEVWTQPIYAVVVGEGDDVVVRCTKSSSLPGRFRLTPDVLERKRYADLRGQNIPELPEAAAREGIRFIYSVRERGGRVKVVLQAAPPDLVSDFMAGKIVPNLTGYYGDPARGFAGGYEQPAES